MEDRRKRKSGSYQLQHILACIFCVFALVCVLTSLYSISNALSHKTSSVSKRKARSEDNIPLMPPGEDVKQLTQNSSEGATYSIIVDDAQIRQSREKGNKKTEVDSLGNYSGLNEKKEHAKTQLTPQSTQARNNFSSAGKEIFNTTLKVKIYPENETKSNLTASNRKNNPLQFYDNITRAFFATDKIQTDHLPFYSMAHKHRAKNMSNDQNGHRSNATHKPFKREPFKSKKTIINHVEVASDAKQKQPQLRSGGVSDHELVNKTKKVPLLKKDVEIPKFPENYHASGLLILPHSNIAEPFEIWYAPKFHKSRIDYYYGTDKTFQRADLGENGFAYKYVPMYNDVQGSFDGCWTLNGTKDRPIIPQIITPNISWFKYEKDEVYTGTLTTKWKYQYSVYGMKNSQSVWITKSKPHRPIRYEMFGFDMMLGSYYDHYVINYITFDEWDGNEDVFKLPSGIQCNNWTNSLSSSLIVNPMQEFSAFTPEQSIDLNERYEDYKLKHKKNYTEKEEENKRKHIFKHNVRYVNSHNRKNLPYKLNENHFVDMSQDELNTYHGSLGKDSKNHKGIKDIKEAEKIEKCANKKDSSTEEEELPEELDWRDFGAVTSVKGQGICGACYAITATGAVEGAWYRKTGKLVEVSSQQLVDCSWGLGNHGCKGGHYAAALSWVYTHGISTMKSYGKYLGQEGYCHLNDTWFGANIEGFSYIQPWNKTALKRAVAKYGPIAVSINSSPLSFKFYSHGVYSDLSCSPNHTSHSALVIGYGIQNGIDYWLIKNSWSSSWGIGGYMKITMDKELCGITEYPVAVVVKNPQFRMATKTKIKTSCTDKQKTLKTKHSAKKATKTVQGKRKHASHVKKIQNHGNEKTSKKHIQTQSDPRNFSFSHHGKKHRSHIKSQQKKVFVNVSGASLIKANPSKIIHIDQYAVAVPLKKNITSNRFTVQDAKNSQRATKDVTHGVHKHPLNKATVNSKESMQFKSNVLTLQSQVKDKTETKVGGGKMLESEQTHFLKGDKNRYTHATNNKVPDQEATALLSQGKHLHNLLKTFGEKIENNENIHEEISKTAKLSPENIGAYASTFAIQSQPKHKMPTKKLTIGSSMVSVGKGSITQEKSKIIGLNPQFALALSRVADPKIKYAPSLWFGFEKNQNEKPTPAVAVKPLLKDSITKAERENHIIAPKAVVNLRHAATHVKKEVSSSKMESMGAKQRLAPFMTLRHQDDEMSASKKEHKPETNVFSKQALEKKKTNYEKEAKHSMELLYTKIDNAVKHVKEDSKPSVPQIKGYSRNKQLSKARIPSNFNQNPFKNSQVNSQYSTPYFQIKNNLQKTYNAPRSYSLNLKNIFADSPTQNTQWTHNTFFSQQNQNTNYG